MNVALRPDIAGRPDPVGAPLGLISLCTGGGGLELGLDLATDGRARTICHVEREAFAVANLVGAMEAGLMALAPVWSDVRSFDGRPWRGLVSGVVGGIPCQPHSVAGRKRGSLDERDLWSAMRRIVVAARPWFVLVENVAGMLSAGKDEIAGAERVVRDLRRFGFLVEGGLFSAAEVGAPHERQRVFILGVGHADDARPQGHRHAGERACERPARPAGGAVADAASVRRREGWPEPVVRGGRDAASGDDGAMDDAARRAGRLYTGSGRPDAGAADAGGAGRPAWPPRPDDGDGWRAVLAGDPALEPAVRRMADGVAAGLDPRSAERIHRLRLLGNGVVPLVAAHAVRTLGARLAARGVARATELVGVTG